MFINDADDYQYNAYGTREGAREHRLVSGDEGRPWRTFQELVSDMNITRGALDALVFKGLVPWVTGATLRNAVGYDAIVRMGGVPPPIEELQVYYALEKDKLMVHEAAVRLGAEPSKLQAYLKRHGVRIISEEP
jgi:hypothetical protein